MALDLYDLIDHGSQLLGWSTGTPEGQQRMAADLRLLVELQELTAAEAAVSRDFTQGTSAKPQKNCSAGDLGADRQPSKQPVDGSNPSGGVSRNHVVTGV